MNMLDVSEKSNILNALIEQTGNSSLIFTIMVHNYVKLIVLAKEKMIIPVQSHVGYIGHADIINLNTNYILSTS